jgi:hypothetical protein
MIDALIAHSQEIGLLCSGFVAGVFFAAWRQVSIEAVPPPPTVYDQEARS